MAKGDSGEFFTIHVKLIVEPVLIKISGPPIMVVNGSVNVISKLKLVERGMFAYRNVNSPTTDR